jgi:trimeric autotransporter adhesin
LAAPAAALAETYVVNTLAGTSSISGCELPESECSLPDAIYAANHEDPGPSTIEFAVEGTIELKLQPEAIVEPLTIDATTPLGYEGSPVVEVDGSEIESEIPTGGFVTYGEGQLTLEGLAINGFEYNVVIADDGEPSQICGNYIGTDLSGTEARPSPGVFEPGAGVLVAPGFESTENEIGGPGCPGNVISGNGEAGILDYGEDTEIEGNRIGTDPSGLLAIPNGTGSESESESESEYEFSPAGVVVGSESFGVWVFGNTIAHNEGPGVLVEGGAAGVTISFNSIFSNSGKGIEFPSAPQPAPELGAATTGAGTTVSGSLHGEPNEPYYVDFFANPECDPSGSGEVASLNRCNFAHGAGSR